MVCRLLRLIAIGLQLPGDFFDPYFDAAISNIRTIRYLPGQHRARDGVFGVGASCLRTAAHVRLHCKRQCRRSMQPSYTVAVASHDALLLHCRPARTSASTD